METTSNPAEAAFEISVSAFTTVAVLCLVVWLITIVTKNMSGWTEAIIGALLIFVSAALRHLAAIEPTAGLTPLSITVLSSLLIATGGFHFGNFIRVVLLK